MGKEDEIKTNLDDKRQLIERIERLEIGLILIINQLRVDKNFPQSLLDRVESIVLRTK